MPKCPAGAARASASEDYFSLLGLPRQPSIDLARLESRYYKLMRKVHPDLHYKGSREEKDASLKNSALITTAYRTLKDPVERGRYWLEINGEKLSQDNIQVPKDLAEKAFDIIDNLNRWKSVSGEGKEHLSAALAESGKMLGSMKAESIKSLEKNFSRCPKGGSYKDSQLLTEMKEILSRVSYISSLIRDIEKTLGA